MTMNEPQPDTIYTCPMHPEVEQPAAGKCPKCGMDLVPREKGKHEQGPSSEHDSATADHREMTRKMREKWLWTNFTVIGLGLWLVISPFTFDYTSVAMTWNDVISGTMLGLLAALALWPRFDFLGRWGVSFVGLWLQLAPLVLWAPDAVAYVNDTLIGALVIALSILVPMMPGMAHHMEMMKPGPEIPPGWTYNPSTWHQRAPMIALGLLGWFISRHLAAYQLGYSQTVWEPFFGKGTENVLTSEVSRMWPISDAGLGALAYTIEFLMAWMGGKTRWRTMPWMVTFFFILVVPLGLTHIVLVILQPVAVGSWCTLCLAAAFVMLVMIPFTVDEVFAMGQFLAWSVRNGKPFWRTFWVGGTMEGGSKDDRTPTYGAPVKNMVTPMAWGVTAPWSLVLSALLGVGMMVAPWALGMEGTAAKSNQVAGALVVTVSIIVMAEVVRAGRMLNVVLGIWLAASPWLFAGFSSTGTWSSVIVGIALVLLSFLRGRIQERYGGWDTYVV